MQASPKFSAAGRDADRSACAPSQALPPPSPGDATQFVSRKQKRVLARGLRDSLDGPRGGASLCATAGSAIRVRNEWHCRLSGMNLRWPAEPSAGTHGGELWGGDVRRFSTALARTSNRRVALACVGSSQAMSTIMVRASWRRVFTGQLIEPSGLCLEQFSACFSARLGQVVVWFRTALDGSRFDAIGATSHERPA